MATKRLPAWAKDATWAAECGAAMGPYGAPKGCAQRFRVTKRYVMVSKLLGKDWTPCERRYGGRRGLLADVKDYPEWFPNFRIMKGGRS